MLTFRGQKLDAKSLSPQGQAGRFVHTPIGGRALPFEKKQKSAKVKITARKMLVSDWRDDCSRNSNG
ncbi:MAG: hypothetical protein COA65_04995 [Rhodospirillaceae bacterium]|nr:MAG: hypothetical protein COA65_04995 [Rhodospirillaceae bacterium]